MDEVKTSSENGISDWSFLDTSPQNTDVLVALSPHSNVPDDQQESFIQVHQKYVVHPPCNSNTLSRQLLSRHRNCFEIALLMEHFKHTSSLGSYLDPSNDLPLEKDTLPNGRLPIWIQCGERHSIYSRTISSHHMLQHDVSFYELV